MTGTFLTDSRVNKFVFYGAFIALALHLIFYVSVTANPYLRSDGWFFVSEFLMPFYNGEFSFSDLYLLRNNADHAQPLHRILLFANAILFDMDFRYEAVFGCFFTILIAGAICIHFQNSHNLTKLPKDIVAGMIAIVMLVFSLNSTGIYTWSLVAMGFVPLFINMVFFIYLSNLIVRNEGSYITLIILGVLMLFVGDDGSVLAMVVAGLVILMSGLVTKNRYIWKPLLVVVSLAIAYQIFKSYMVSVNSSSGKESALFNSAQYYMRNWDMIYKVVAAPFSDSFFHRIHLVRYPELKEPLSLFIGFLLMLLHGYIWYAFFKFKLYKKSYLPVMLMLYSYALTAGIMLYRVPDFGIGYMHQPRYVRAYQIGLWGSTLALLSLYTVSSDNKKVFKKTLYFAVSIIMAVQLGFIHQAWHAKKYIVAWQKNHAENIIYYGGDEVLGKPCSKAKAGFPICKMKNSKRERLIGFLKDEELNVFSERVRKDYLY